MRRESRQRESKARRETHLCLRRVSMKSAFFGVIVTMIFTKNSFFESYERRITASQLHFKLLSVDLAP